jgi:2,5-dihydroxypyridine 5,6-dioxygenase
MEAVTVTEVENWKTVLTLSKLRSDEKVCVLTGPTTNERNLHGAIRALQEMGAAFMQLNIPPRGKAIVDRTAYLGITPITGNRTAIDTLKSVGLVIDLLGLSHSDEQLEILKAGARILMVIEPHDILGRIMPSADDKRRVLAADARLHGAREMRVTSKAGTDLTLQLGQFGTLPEYGFADEPGHWDHWPSGFTSIWPNEGKGEGAVVIDTGDILFPFKMYVQTPIRLTIRDGWIRSIEGGFEAEYLREHMAGYQDAGAYGIAHVGWGLQPLAKWTALAMHDKSRTLGMDGRSFYGNFLFSTGPNSEAGGSNRSPCHVDIPMRNCSVYLDGEPMVIDGDVIPDDQRVPGAVPQTGTALPIQR